MVRNGTKERPTTSPTTIAVLVLASLIDSANRRAEAMSPLSVAVARAVAELDPNRERDTRPTWWQDLPPWHSLDAVDRLRLAHDQLVVLEVQAEQILAELQSSLESPGEGHGRSWRQAHTDLAVMAARRGEHLGRLRLAERRVRSRLLPATSADLRKARRLLVAEEQRAGEQRARLAVLLRPPESAAS